MKFCLILIFILFNAVIVSQSVQIRLLNNEENYANLYLLEGEKASLVDSIKIYSGDFSYNMNENSAGIYRISFNKNNWFNFIYDGKDIEINTDYNNILDSLKIIKSESNRHYYQFLKLNKEYRTKIDLLNLILVRYPQDDEYYETTKEKLKKLQEEYSYFVDITSQLNQNSFIARYIKTEQLPIIPQSVKVENQLEYLKKHALDNVNFNDAELIYSDAFTNKTIEYLTYYRNPQLPKELLEKEFMKAVDTLLNKAKVNQLVYQHIADYLIDGFKKFGFDKIIDYIIENYIIEDDLCLDEETENSIQRRIDQSKLLAIGNIVPNIIMPEINGEVIELSKIKSAKTMLVFYSSQCPHCHELLPKLNELKISNPEIEILAISLDSKKENWIEFVNENKLDVININDPNGWDGQAASDYFIYATPTMFLLDRNKKVLSKPITYNELLQALVK